MAPTIPATQSEPIPLLFIGVTLTIMMIQLVLYTTKPRNDLIDTKFSKYFKYMIWNKLITMMVGVVPHFLQRLYRSPIMMVSKLSILYSINAMLGIIVYGLSTHIAMHTNDLTNWGLFIGTYLYYLYYLYRSWWRFEEVFVAASCIAALYAQTKVFVMQ